jgi:subtilisin family serine protease
MRTFADFIRNYRSAVDQVDVRVALIDDGVDAAYQHLSKNIVRGETYSRRNPDLYNAYYQSTNGHGTVMACLIRQMCPKVKLYVAKLDEKPTDDGMQITTASAAKVCFLGYPGTHIHLAKKKKIPR